MELSVWLPLEVKLTSQFQTALLRTLLWKHREGKIPEALRIGLSPKCFYRDLFVIADLNELMSMNLLIQTCHAGNFFLFVQRALEGNITVRQMIELGVLPCFIFSHCLRQRFAVFHGGARTQQRMNRICTKTQ